MQFEQLPTPGLDTDVQNRRTEIQNIANKLNIDSRLLPPIRAVILWKEVLTKASAEEQKLLLSYLETTGSIPSQGIRSPIKLREPDTKVIEAACYSFVTELITSKTSPEELITRSASSIRNSYPEISKPQIQILQHMVKHQVELHSLELGPLEAQMPFPLMQHNYFGRFISNGAENPAQAVRHLHVAMPFLVRMKSFIEGLQNKKLHHMLLLVESAHEQQLLAEGQKPAIQDRMTQEQRNEALTIVHAVIEQSTDLYGGALRKDHKPLTCIALPYLPEIAIHQFDPSDHLELAGAVYDWMLFGTNHPILESRSLSPSRQRQGRTTLETLARRQSELAKLEPPSKKSDNFAAEQRAYKRTERKLTKGIERCETILDELLQEEANIISIREQLESPTGLLPAVRRFRRDIREALQADARIVFTFFSSEHTEAPGSSLELLDLAIANRHKKSFDSTAIDLLAESPMLLSMPAHRRIAEGRAESPRSMLETSIRNFEINVDEINHSVRFLFSGLLPNREDPQLSSLLETICGEMDLPGVRRPEQLVSLVKQATGKRKLNPTHVVDYLFERAPEMSTSQLFSLLVNLHAIGVKTISPTAQRISHERFKHPKRTIPMFERFATGYQPNKLGEAPEIFEDLSSFQDYLSLGLDALGMAPELAQIEKHLSERGIVAVVDGTNYHPELDAEVAATGDKLEKGDSEQTTEVWGEYVRPSERLIRAFSLRLMEGDVDPSLQHSSLMGIIRPDKADQVMQLIVKKFYGIDIDISPNLTAINQLLSDLKIHDEKSILVLDANSISNLEQYREFLEHLERYQIKIILRTREPFPGIPQVNIQPFLDASVTSRLQEDSEKLQSKLDLATVIEPELVAFATEQVMRCRTPQADPLNLTLQVLNSAAAHARLHPDRSICQQDIVAAIPSIFHLPDGEQMRLRLDAMEAFIEQAPIQVLGQDKAIKTIANRVRNHILGMRDPTRPLTLLLPGPTGVGKTELMMHFARICDIPFFMIEGAEFSEEHTVSRLVGSPSGYVGPDEGILYTFLKENNSGLIFIDEIEKMHPSVYQSLMNFFDKATLTAGNGKTISRPGFIIAGASNAGADKLTRDMEERKVKEILAESFVDRRGQARPELVRRFEPIVMPAIEEPAFQEMLHRSLASIGKRPGFVAANLELVGIDEVSTSLLYDVSKKVCEYSEKEIRNGLGFHCGEIDQPSSTGLFYDMRHVSRALDELAGESLQRLAIEQYQSGNHLKRGVTRPVRLVGNAESRTITVVDANSIDEK